MAKKKPTDQPPIKSFASVEAAFASNPENAAGSYAAAWWFPMFVAWVDRLFPGAGEFVQMAADFVPWSKLLNAVLEAIKDWREGQDFIGILKDALSEWIDIEIADDEPIRMTAKGD